MREHGARLQLLQDGRKSLARLTAGMTLKILSTTDLADWSNPEERTLTVGGNGKQAFNHESDPQRFYKLKAE